MMNESDRTEYITLAAEALNESTFPRLRALVYLAGGSFADYENAYATNSTLVAFVSTEVSGGALPV
jgi:hypothetical protein